MTLLSQKTILSINEENQKKKEQIEENIDKRKKIEPGEQVLKINNSSYEMTKNGGEMMFVIELIKDETYRPVLLRAKWEGKGSDIGQKILVTFLKQAFLHDVSECDENGMLAQIKQHTGKEFKACIKLKRSLYNTKEGNLIVVEKPEFSYAGHIDDANFYVNKNRIIQDLSKEDKERFVATQKHTENQTNEIHSNKENDNLPF